MRIQDHLKVLGIIDDDEYAVLSFVNPITVWTAHLLGIESLRDLIALHAVFLTKGFRKPLQPQGNTDEE